MDRTRYRLVLAILVLVAAVLTGCGAAPAPAATGLAVTATVSQPEATTPAPAATEPSPVMTGSSPLPTATDSAPAPGNPFTRLLGPISAPPGWTVEPCEGEGPFLCVSAGDEFPGSVELLQYPLEQHHSAQQWMAEAGLEAGEAIDPQDPEQVVAAREVLHALRTDHMAVIEEDREITYPEGRWFVLLEPEEVMVGQLPGLFYGFAGVEEDGETYERWLTYAAVDGETVHILTAFYDPSDTPGSFWSDEALLTFAPHLREIVAGLRLP